MHNSRGNSGGQSMEFSELPGTLTDQQATVEARASCQTLGSVWKAAKSHKLKDPRRDSF